MSSTVGINRIKQGTQEADGETAVEIHGEGSGIQYYTTDSLQDSNNKIVRRQDRGVVEKVCASGKESWGFQ